MPRSPLALASCAGASLFALQNKAANAADWGAIKGQKVRAAKQWGVSSSALRGAPLACSPWRIDGRQPAASCSLPSPPGCCLSLATKPLPALHHRLQVCSLAGYYLNPDLKTKYGADLVEVPDEAAMLDKWVAGDCSVGELCVYLAPACTGVGSANAS